VYAGCQWLVLIVLAKLGSPAMVGQFALALAVTAPVMLFFSLQLREVQATDAARAYSFREYLGLRAISTCLGLLIVAAAVLALGYRGTTALAILIVGLTLYLRRE